MAKEVLRFQVPGEVAPLQRHKHRVCIGPKGAYAQIYEPGVNKTSRAYVRTCAMTAIQAAGISRLLEGPLGIEIIVWRAWPPSKQVKNPSRVRPDILLEKSIPGVKPDLDNVIKLVWDACNKVVWRDDAQVSSITAHKRYTDGQPTTEIIISKLELSDAGDRICVTENIQQTRLI